MVRWRGEMSERGWYGRVNGPGLTGQDLVRWGVSFHPVPPPVLVILPLAPRFPWFRQHLLESDVAAICGCRGEGLEVEWSRA